MTSLNILVVVPTHDRLEFVSDALLSLCMQIRKADQVVVAGNVVPDCLPRRCARQISMSWRTGLCLASRMNTVLGYVNRGAFILLSDDDQLDPEYIERVERAMVEQHADVVTTGVRLIGDPTLDRKKHHIPGTPHMSALWSRAAWEAAGGYRDVPMLDQDLWARAQAAGHGKLAWVREPLFWYRIHDKQESYTNPSGAGAAR